MTDTPSPEPPRSVRTEVLDQLLTLLIGGLGLVAALAWNDAVRAMFDAFFPQRGGIIAKFVYAVLVTVVIVLVTMRLRRLKPRREQ